MTIISKLHRRWNGFPSAARPIACGEFAENAIRKDFLPSEAVAIKRTLEPAEKEAAKERMGEGGRGGKLPHPKAKTRDKVAAFTGMAARTLDKANQLVAAAEAEPDKYGKPVEQWTENPYDSG